MFSKVRCLQLYIKIKVMKNILTLFMVVFFFGSSYAQNDMQVIYNQNAIKISPFEFGRAEFQLHYERYFNNRKSSITVAPSIFLRDNANEKANGWQLMSQYRFYLTHYNGEADRIFLGLYNVGFYTGLYGLYLDYSEDFVSGQYDPISSEYIMSTYNKTVNSFEAGPLLGVQIDITKRILIDFFVGGGIRWSDYTNSYTDEIENYGSFGVFDTEYTGVKPKLGFTIGITI